MAIKEKRQEKLSKLAVILLNKCVASVPHQTVHELQLVTKIRFKAIRAAKLIGDITVFCAKTKRKK